MRKIQPQKHATDGGSQRPVTFRAAEDLGPFELAQLWCDRTAWPIIERTVYDELAELAVMSALAKWLRSWQPIAIHGAMLAGARPEAVVAAMGNSLEVAYERVQSCPHCGNSFRVQAIRASRDDRVGCVHRHRWADARGPWHALLRGLQDQGRVV